MKITDNTLPQAEDGDNGSDIIKNLPVTADSAEAEKENTAAADTGKFKSVAALMEAYSNLEAEFTRRSQRLKELEERSKAQNMPQKGAPSCGSGEAGEDFFKAAVADERVKKTVIEEYLRGVTQNRSVPLMVAGVPSAAPKTEIKDVRQAGALAKNFFNG